MEETLIKVIMASKHLWATKLSDNSSTAKEQLGIKRIEWNTTDACFKAYRYVQAASDTTVANGTCLGFSDTLRQTVSLDVSNGDIEENQPAGVGIGTGTASYYFWVQTGGYHSALLTDGGTDFANGCNVLLHASTDGVAEYEAVGASAVSLPLGIAVGAYSDSTVPTFLTLDEV